MRAKGAFSHKTFSAPPSIYAKRGREYHSRRRWWLSARVGTLQPPVNGINRLAEVSGELKLSARERIFRRRPWAKVIYGEDYHVASVQVGA